jgi:quercetin dioxygenase-like cupin family protein
MQMLPKQRTVKGLAEMFTGDVCFDVIANRDEPSRTRVNTVGFSPGARTAWHCHAVGQTLYVTEDVGRIQSRDGEVIEIRPGEVIYTRPGQWHWHGAAPDYFMTHIAMWEAPAPDSVPESEWGTSSPTRCTRRRPPRLPLTRKMNNMRTTTLGTRAPRSESSAWAEWA